MGVPICGLIGVFIDAVVFWMAAGFKKTKVLQSALLSQSALIIAWAIGYGLSTIKDSPSIYASAPFVAFGIQVLANYFIIGDYLRFKEKRFYITLAVCIALGNIPFLLLALLDSIGRYGIRL